MIAELEIVGAILRVWLDNTKYPEPFEMVLYIVGDTDTAILKGLKMDGTTLTTRHRHAIMECLKRNGFKRAIWHRWKKVDGVVTLKEIAFNIP